MVRAYQFTPDQHVQAPALVPRARGSRSAPAPSRGKRWTSWTTSTCPSSRSPRWTSSTCRCCATWPRSGARCSSRPAWPPWARSSRRSRRSATDGNDQIVAAPLRLDLSARARDHPSAQHGDAARRLRRAGGLQRPHAGHFDPPRRNRPRGVRHREALHPRQGHGRLGSRHLGRSGGAAHDRGGGAASSTSALGGSARSRQRGGDREARAVPPQSGDAARPRREATCSPRRTSTPSVPGTGVSPDELRYVLGRRLAADVEEDHVIRWEDLE